MKNKITFAFMFEEAKKYPTYHVETIHLEFTEAVCKRMKELNINKTELAKRTNTRLSVINKMFVRPCSLKLMVKVLMMLNCSIEFKVIEHPLKQDEQNFGGWHLDNNGKVVQNSTLL